MSDADQFSRLAQGAYQDLSHDSASNTDYIVHPNASYSDSNMTTYHHKDDMNHIVIAHRGSSIPGTHNSTFMRDWQNNTATMWGVGGKQARQKRRMQRTEEIINATNPTTLHLTGHSLGGGSVNHTIANSEFVRDRLTSAHTFNAAVHPVMSNQQSVSRNERKRLSDKVTHHRIENDVVSMGFKFGAPFGKVSTYKPLPVKRTLGQQVLHGLSGFTTGGVAASHLTAHGIEQFFGQGTTRNFSKPYATITARGTGIKKVNGGWAVTGREE